MNDDIYELVSYTYRDLEAAGHLDRFVGGPAVYLATLAGFTALLVLIVSAVRWRVRARRAAATVRDDAALAPGHVGVRGVVEHLPGAPGAVRLEIAQEGDEWESSGAWVHSWTEKNRRMLVHPFLIRLASGARVLVHPDQHAFLADALDGVVRINRVAGDAPRSCKAARRAAQAGAPRARSACRGRSGHRSASPPPSRAGPTWRSVGQSRSCACRSASAAMVMLGAMPAEHG